MSRSGAARLVVVAGLALLAGDARAGETDNYYAWLRRVPDGSRALDDKLNDGFARVLDELNASGASSSYSCHEVADLLLSPFFNTGMHFVFGATEGWGFPYAPSSDTELRERYEPRGLYRFYGLLPLGFVVPVEPTVNASGIHFGTDKLGHFLTNGPRYYDEYRRALDEGRAEEEALAAAIELGIWQEGGILGGFLTSAFSYGDLEANFQGLELMRDWCERGELARDDDGRWRLNRPFTLARYVNPCWDESFYPNAYDGLTAVGVKRSLVELCPLLRSPRVRRLRDDYRARGCTSFSVRYLEEKIARGAIPDPAPFDVDEVCRAPTNVEGSLPSAR